MHTDERREFEFAGDFVGKLIPAATRPQSADTPADCPHGVPANLACIYCTASRNHEGAPQ
jgi:hypothetical protein